MISDINDLFKLKKKNNKYLINILSYFIFFLSNLVFLILIPSELNKVFFVNYSIANGVFSYFIVLIFSQKKIIDTKFSLFFFTLFTIFCFTSDSLIFLIWFYTSILIYADYFFSQKKYIKSNLFIKFSLLLISCLLFFDQFSLYLVMNIKILYLLICILTFYILKIDQSNTLEVKKPNLYVISTCIIYFGSLYIIAFITVNELIKLFYISFQVFLSIRLKIFDLNIRGILKINKYGKIIFISAFIYFMTISIFSNLYFLLILFLISYFSLDYVDKKFIQN